KLRVDRIARRRLERAEIVVDVTRLRHVERIVVVAYTRSDRSDLTDGERTRNVFEAYLHLRRYDDERNQGGEIGRRGHARTVTVEERALIVEKARGAAVGRPKHGDVRTEPA